MPRWFRGGSGFWKRRSGSPVAGLVEQTGTGWMEEEEEGRTPRAGQGTHPEEASKRSR